MNASGTSGATACVTFGIRVTSNALKIFGARGATGAGGARGAAGAGGAGVGSGLVPVPSSPSVETPVATARPASAVLVSSTPIFGACGAAAGFGATRLTSFGAGFGGGGFGGSTGVGAATGFGAGAAASSMSMRR